MSGRDRAGYKHLFQRALAAAPDRLHMAPHSHHLWPDASFVGHLAAWQDAVRLADRKWDRVMNALWPAAQRHIASELHLADPSTIVFATNTHALLVGLFSAHPARRPLRVLASDGEFMSFRRQAMRWVESGEILLETIEVEQPDFQAQLVERSASGAYDLIFVSHVMFGSGLIVDCLAKLAAVADPKGPWVVIDGYHGFMAVDTNLSAIDAQVFYLAGGYKYAMAGEGAAFMHAPHGFGPRPTITGWYAAFDEVSSTPGREGYASDARRFMGATFDPSGLYRFVAVRDMLLDEEINTSAISAHAIGLQQRFLDRLGVTPLSSAVLLNPPGSAAHARFLAFRSPHALRWKEELDREEVIVDVRQDVLRVGFGLYHDEGDIDRLSDILSRLD